MIVVLEGEEIHAESIENLFSEIILTNISHLGKDMDVQAQKVFRTLNRHDPKEPPKDIFLLNLQKKRTTTTKA